MDRPGDKDCKIVDGGIWLSKSILETMARIYRDKEMFAEVKPASYYQGKKEVIEDLLKFISERQ